ncbi:hypothetical protein LCH21_02575 [Patescibacteria group bacterium]|nr:hypothetical protein [Patescibacteria group bacterium]
MRRKFGANCSRISARTPPVALVLDRLRVMMIVSFRKVEEGIMTVQLRDVDDKTIVVLALPYTAGARAQAEITSFDDKEA